MADIRQSLPGAAMRRAAGSGRRNAPAPTGSAPRRGPASQTASENPPCIDVVPASNSRQMRTSEAGGNPP